MKLNTLIGLSLVLSSLAGAVEVSLVEKDQENLEIQFSLSPEEATPKKVKALGKSFSRLNVQNEGFQFGYEGLPEIPRVHRWLVVNQRTRYKVEIVPGRYRIYRNILLYPAQRDVFEQQKPSFEMSQKAYVKNSWYGSQKVVLGTRAKLGSLTIQPISFFPASYNPLKRELRVYEDIKVRLVPLEVQSPGEPLYVSSFVSRQVSQLTLNGTSYLSRFTRMRETTKYLLGYGAGFESYANELAAFYEAQGVQVTAVEVPAGIKPNNLRELLIQNYKESNFDAILLFGDEGSIPLRESNGNLGDFGYSLLSGTDQISDVAVGRLPVKNEVQAKTIINKIKKYTELKEAGYRNKKVMLVAHYQDYPGKYTGNMESVRKSPNPRGLEFNTQYGGEAASNKTVLEEAKKGYAIINYRGHGSSNSWSSWGSDAASFGTSQVKALPAEESSLSFIFNVACTNGAIQKSSPALVETELFPNDDPTSLQGAVGTFGATAPSLTEVNHRFNLHLFRFLQNETDITIGNVYSLANNRLTQENGGSAVSNTKMYVLYSDPLLVPWID